MPRVREKNASIETLRGIAILLMVAGHVIGATAAEGMRVAPDSSLRHFYYSLQFLRLPLFTTISGFVYALRPLSSADAAPTFMRGKLRRLMLPMITVGTLEFLLRTFVPGINHREHMGGMWRIYVFGFDHLWFLQAILVVFAGVVALEAAGVMQTVQGWFLAFTASCLLHVSEFDWEVFSMGGAATLAPFMLLGIGIARFPALQSPWAIAPLSVVCVVALGYQQWTWFTPGARHVMEGDAMGLAIGVSGITLLFRVRRAWAPLSRLGSYAYGIYLLHVLGTAPGRLLANKAGAPTMVVFATSLVLGIVGPILVEHVLSASPLLSLLVFGERSMVPTLPPPVPLELELPLAEARESHPG